MPKEQFEAGVFDICSECCLGIIYGAEGDDIDEPKVKEFAEEHGVMVVTDHHVSHYGYWECECCNQTQIGPGYHLEES